MGCRDFETTILLLFSHHSFLVSRVVFLDNLCRPIETLFCPLLGFESSNERQEFILFYFWRFKGSKAIKCLCTWVFSFLSCSQMKSKLFIHILYLILTFLLFSKFHIYEGKIDSSILPIKISLRQSLKFVPPKPTNRPRYF